MNELSSGKPIRYCYQCGTRLGPHVENCWYCGVAVQRSIRPPRRCPFCAEPIRPETIKCPHCGEFVDGRQHVDTRPVRQIIVIDKNLLQTMSDMRLFPGSPVPDTARHVLEDHTIRAIEENAPDAIRQPGVHVLPAPPETSSPMLIEYKPGEGVSSEIVPYSTPLAPVKSAPLVPAGPAQPLAPYHATPLARPTAPSAKGEAVMDAEASDVYRICDSCKTEILAGDNFCYYCGHKYRPTPTDRRREAAERRRRFYRRLALLLFLAVIVGAAYLYFSGALTAERFADIRQTVSDRFREKLGIGAEELAGLDPKNVAEAVKCRKNLARIQSAKRKAAAETGQESGAIPLEDVLKELKTSELPACPAGGTYSLNPLEKMPTCSIGDNGTTSTLDDHIITDK